MSNIEKTALLARSARLYRQGIFCPAELWWRVTTVLVGSDDTQVLDSLPPDLREVLREAFRERPWSLRSEWCDDEVRLRVEVWCLQVEPEGKGESSALAT